MDGKSKVLLWFTIILVGFTIVAVFYKTVVLEDFQYNESDPVVIDNVNDEI